MQKKIEHELKLIDELNYAPYFLTVHDLVRFARGRGILCQGRGAAANSAVCYCLGVTSVDPDRIDLLFERFVSRERDEPPDIDIDFEHERREEVLQYVYEKYGRQRAALCAEVISYRGRSAVREVGKALGLSLDCVDRLAKQLDWWDKGSINVERVRELGLDPDDPTMQRLADLAGQIMGFPRHLSQHVGGFVITDGPLCELVPIENAAMDRRTVIEWDKDDIDAMGMLKVDCLGLGMLTCLNKAFRLLCEVGAPGAARLGGPHHGFDLSRVPPEDPAVYDMICDADTVGVFQIESRAQMSMLPRLRPRNYYDIVIEVAIVRPGPIVGDMVHPYLRRRHGEEPAVYPTPVVKEILGKTLGVPLFQEQAMRLAIECAGFTPGEADQLRRAIAAWKRKQKVIYEFGQKIINGMIARGYDRHFAEQTFERIKGFSEYGFPESHAASFALIVYASAWLKCYHPAAFAAGLINSQPMGFYAPAQIVRDAKEHGVEVRPIDVNHSGWDCLLEAGSDEATTRQSDEEQEASRSSADPSSPALRLGMRLVRGLRAEDAARVEQAVNQHGRFDSIESLWRASGVSVATLRRLARADAFGSMGIDRQRALWHVRRLRDERLPLFEKAGDEAAERRGDGGEQAPRSPGGPSSLRRSTPPSLPPVTAPAQVVHDYAATGVSLRPHPMSFLRNRLRAMDAVPNGELANEKRWPNGMPVSVAGLVLLRQRPGTAKGVVFITLEDETGIANLIIRPAVWDTFRRAARHATCLLVRGRVERKHQVVHVMAQKVIDLGGELDGLLTRSRDFR